MTGKAAMTGDTDLRIVADTMPAAAVRCSREQRFLWVNARYARWVGRPAEDIVGRSVGEIIGEEVLRSIQPSIDLVLGGKPAQYERLARCGGWASGG